MGFVTSVAFTFLLWYIRATLVAFKERRMEWLLFTSQLPGSPSSLRVMVWRRMKAAGALGLQNGIWVLPHKDSARKFIQEMKAYVESQGGTSQTFVANTLDGMTETEILERFRQDRAQEYEEIKEQCIDFLAEIEKETKRKNFSFAEYEENEQDLDKLKVWYEKVKQRDFIGGDQAKESDEWLEKCQQALQGFATEVFNHEESDEKKGQ
jgi:hypothetical protein